MATFDDVRRLAMALPEVEESTSYGTPSLQVNATGKGKGKSFCRLWSEREHDRDDVHDTEVLVVCELEAKDLLLEAHPPS